MFNIKHNNSAFLAMYLHRLRKLVTSQSDDVFDTWGVSAPSSCTSIFLYLHERQSASITELSERLQYSHQLISQRLRILEKQGFIEKHSDARDQRKSRIVLTDTGKQQAARLLQVLPLMADSIDQLFDELGVDLASVSDRACELLNNLSLDQRVQALRQAPSDQSGPRRRKQR